MKQEFTGKDIDSAIKAACSALDIPRKDLEYRVISSGSSGIFGIVGRKEARIRVKYPSSAGDSDFEKEGIKSIVDEAFGQESPKQKVSENQSSARKKKTEAKESASNQNSLENKENPEDQKEDSARKDQEFRKPEQPRELKEKDSQENQEEQETRKAQQQEEDQENDSSRAPADHVPSEFVVLAQEAVQKMADLITDEAVVSAHAENDVLTLKIEGGSSGILIGRKGQTLDAMQFLVDKMVNRQSQDRIRVRMDVEGYMETRKANLRHLARKMAAKAKKTGRPATINQMNAQDRRIIHMALKNDNHVRTQSMGEGYYRRLVIFPKKKYKGTKGTGK